MNIKSHPRILITGSTDVEVIVLLCRQLVFEEGLADDGGVGDEIVGMIVVVVLDRRDGHGLTEQLHIPLVIVGNTVPGDIHGVRCRVVEFEIKRFDTRRIFEFDVIDDDIATHDEVRSQTGGDGQLVIRQFVVGKDETCLLER